MRPVYIRGDYHVCPNPLSADSYSICELNCKYCFVREMYHGLMKKTYEKGLLPTELKTLERTLKVAFSRKESNNVTVLGIRAGLPVIIGRKSEPFCPSEKKYHNTEGMMKLFRDYGVNAFVESKGNISVDTVSKYCEGALVSIMTASPDIIKKLEPDSPSVDSRFNIAKELKETGLFVGITGEPFLPLFDNGFEKEYAKRVKSTGADHVNFSEFRTHNPKITQKNFSEIGLNLRDILLRSKNNWVNMGTKFMKAIKDEGIKCSSPDWVNFGYENDCEGCCGLDDFGVHHFTFQKAMRILKEKGKVKFSDISKFNIFGDNYEEKFKNIWNNDSKYFGMRDLAGINLIGRDSEGNKIYGKLRGLSGVSL